MTDLAAEAQPSRYPLWRIGFGRAWVAFLLVTLLIAGIFALPRPASLALHHQETLGIVLESGGKPRCSVTYAYSANGESYTDTGERCGLQTEDLLTVYYDTHTPKHAGLRAPAEALRDETLALIAICACLSAFLVLWFRVTYVIGKPLARV